MSSLASVAFCFQVSPPAFQFTPRLCLFVVPFFYPACHFLRKLHPHSLLALSFSLSRRHASFNGAFFVGAGGASCCAVPTSGSLAAAVAVATAAPPTDQRVHGEGEELQDEEDARCHVCNSGDSLAEDPIVFCESCNVPVHQVRGGAATSAVLWAPARFGSFSAPVLDCQPLTIPLPRSATSFQRSRRATGTATPAAWV